MNNRRRFVLGLAGSALYSSCTNVLAQPRAKQWRIGFIGSAPASASPEQAHLWEVFLQAMRERGYVEGMNYTLERRYHEGKVERFPQLVSELVQANVDILILGPAPGVRAAKEATSTIPIVMLSTSDPVGAKLVTSLARPGGNVTGVADYQVDLIPKRIQLLKEAVVSARRVVFLFGNYGGFSEEKIAMINAEQDAAARSVGISFVRVQMNSPDDFDRATEAILSQRPDALLLSPNTTNFLRRQDLADFARKHRLPTITGQREHVVAGAMMSYGVSFDDLLRKTARFVDQILRGAKPADLPVEQPTKFELVINLNTARTIGVVIPPSLLARADELIQ